MVRQRFRLLVTGSRTWHDVQAVEQALAVILDRHPEGVLLVYGACLVRTASFGPIGPASSGST